MALGLAVLCVQPRYRKDRRGLWAGVDIGHSGQGNDVGIGCADRSAVP